jgi:site-specific recombinase XerD
MAEEREHYNTSAIRELLTAAFGADDLRRFCYDRPLFRAVCDRFGSSAGVAHMVDELVVYCERQVLFRELLLEVEKANPRQYASYKDKLSPTDYRERLRQSFSAWMLLEEYFDYLRSKSRSERTISEYRKCLELYFVETKNYSLHVALSELRRWVASMQERGLSSGTVAARTSALRSFFAFAVAERKLISNPVDALPKPRRPIRLPKALTQDEVRAFFAAIDAAQHQDRARRDRIVFRLYYTAGLSTLEAVSVRIEDLDLDSGTLQIHGTGAKERVVPLRPEVVELLSDWVAERRTGWLFSGQTDNQHLSSRVIQQYCREYSEAAGMKRRVSPRVLRASCATHYLAAGAPPAVVQSMLGHANLTSTGRFARVAANERARIVRETPLAL